MHKATDPGKPWFLIFTASPRQFGLGFNVIADHFGVTLILNLTFVSITVSYSPEFGNRHN